MAEAGKVSISEAARMYDKSRKWVYDQLKKHNISTEKEKDGNERTFPLVDLIAHKGEPKNNGTAPTEECNTVEVRTSTPIGTYGTPFFPEKINLLEEQIEALREDKEELKQRLKEERGEARRREEDLREERGRLLGIVEKQAYLLEDKRKTSGEHQPNPNPKVIRELQAWVKVCAAIALVSVLVWILSVTGFSPDFLKP